VAREVHWDLSGKYDFKRNEKWYDHVPESLLENEDTIPEDGRVRAREDEKVKNAEILRVTLEECVL